MIVTKEWLKKHCTANGAYTRKQFESIGLKWPPYKSWQQDIIGHDITDEQAELFISAKDNKYTRRNKKAAQENLAVLNENNIDYSAYNNGQHLKINWHDLDIDFWPTTGTYIIKNDGNILEKGKGVHALIEYLKRQGV